MTRPKVLFVFNRVRAERAQAFARGLAPDDALYGLHAIRERGFDATFDDIGHDIRGVGRLYKAVDDTLSGGGRRVGFHWWQAKRLLPRLREADLVFATADSSALPILWLRRRGLFRAPVVYGSIGLTQSFPDARGALFRWYRGLARSAERVVAFSVREREELVERFGVVPERAAFVPFGVDARFYRARDAGTACDAPPLAFGLDPMRDWPTLAAATKDLALPIDVIAIGDRLAGTAIPANWRVSPPVDFAALAARISAAQFVVLPVRENPYTGATISLLSAMACGKAVVVSRTSALAQGYGLVHDESVVFVKPGDAAELRDAIERLTADPARCARIGASARAHVERAFTVDHMADRLAAIFREVLA